MACLAKKRNLDLMISFLDAYFHLQELCVALFSLFYAFLFSPFVFVLLSGLSVQGLLSLSSVFISCCPLHLPLSRHPPTFLPLTTSIKLSHDLSLFLLPGSSISSLLLQHLSSAHIHIISSISLPLYHTFSSLYFKLI